jgi:hypothetical protein
MLALGLAGAIAAAHAAEPALGARYGSFPAARSAAQRIVTRALGADADSATWRRGTTAFEYRDQRRLAHDAAGKPMWFEEPRDSLTRVPSLTMALQKASGSPPDTDIRDAFEHSGWVEDVRYGADGDDGTRFAMVCREALCFVEGRWESDDPTDTTYVPKPGFKLTMTCVPRPRRSGRATQH